MTAMRMPVFLATILLSTTAMGTDRAFAQEQVPQLSGLPAPLEWQNQPARWSADDKSLTITADEKTDWFVWPGGGTYHPESSPRLLFKTAGNFSFSTRVDVDAHATYDAGCIALYGTPSRWAKLCLEAQDGGGLSVISVVTRDVSDDVTSYPVEGGFTFLKVARDRQTIFFYGSSDGRKWTIVRKFNLDYAGDLKAGFSVQSPEGKAATATFKDFHYDAGAVDLWKLR
jgi:regulation of enolase protein 1 (concanavalin A-like superfamily)